MHMQASNWVAQKTCCQGPVGLEGFRVRLVVSGRAQERLLLLRNTDNKLPVPPPNSALRSANGTLDDTPQTTQIEDF